MTFLQPALLFALPLAILPVAIHLIHLYRRRQIPWAAMMFLRMAQRMNKGLSRLRQVLILTLRVLAVAALLFVITRPLAGGWLGLTGGAPDIVLVLLDRSASMEQQNLATGQTKRAAGLSNLAKAIDDAVGTRSHLVLLESTGGPATPLSRATALNDLPQAAPTETAADLPALLQSALDYITANKSGRTEIWLLSDLQRSDWDASGGRWETLRSAFSTLPGIRFHLLSYPEPAVDDVAIRIDRVTRRETSTQAELLLDLRLTRHATNPQPLEVPLRLVVNGAATTALVSLKENQLALQGYVVPIDKAAKRGWGRVELPADSNPANNVYHFVFAEPPPLRSVIVSDDEAETGPLRAALSAPLEPGRKYVADVLPVRRAAEIPWSETALIVWQAPLPKEGEALAGQLQEHVKQGRSILFLPPEVPDDSALFGLHWGAWETFEKAQPVEWWRNDAGLLANVRSGTALPVGALEATRFCGLVGEGTPLARLAGKGPLLLRAPLPNGGGAYFLGTKVGPGSSSLARDGVVMFALLHRALQEGALTLGKAQQRFAATDALGGNTSGWTPMEERSRPTLASDLPLHAGIVQNGDRLVALNRPPGEDEPEVLTRETLDELFKGLDYRVLTDSLTAGRSLTSEVWRTFLLIMAAAILGEALLCLPPRREVAPAAGSGFARTPPEPASSLP